MKLLLPVGIAVVAPLLLLIPEVVPAYAQNSPSPDSRLSMYAVHIDDKPYSVKYNITGGSIESVEANSTYSTITITIQADSDGRLLVNFPGSLLNRISLNPDEDAAVFVDNIDVFPNMTLDNCDATLDIPFQKGNKQIDVVQTFLVSEAASIKGHFFDATVNGGKGFVLGTVSNADTCSFSLDQSKKQLHVDVSGPADEEGSFQIALPHEFLGGPYTILAEGKPIEFKSSYSNATGRDTTTVSFQYDGGKVHSVDIIGTTAIPEFGSFAIAATIAASMAMIITIMRFKRQ